MLSLQEEKLKGKQGYEHLSEPLHLLIEAELTEDIINSRLEHAVQFLESLLKPVDKSMNHYKREQLKELGALNGTLREGSPKSALEPWSESKHVPFQQQACQDLKIKISTGERISFFLCFGQRNHGMVVWTEANERLQFICFLVIKFILYF